MLYVYLDIPHHSMLFAGWVPNTTPWFQPADRHGFKDIKEGVADEKIKVSKGCATKMNFDRYQLAAIWVKTIKRVWTSSFVATSLRRTGVKPFTRSAHLVGNDPDVEIADTIAESDELQRQAYQRQLRQQEREADEETDREPIRLAQVRQVAQVYGSAEVTELSTEFRRVIVTHQMKEWPRTEASRTKPQVWKICLRNSPAMISRLRQIDADVLRGWFDIGAVVKDMDTLSPAQVNVLL